MTVNALGPEPDAFKLLGAARQDLLVQLPSSGGRRAALHVLPEASIEFTDRVGHGLVVRVEALGGATEVRLSETALRAASTSASAGITPLVLLSCALSGEALRAEWRPQRVGHAQLPSQATLDYYSRLHRVTPGSSKVAEELAAGHDVMVVGDHGCGKSALVANVAEQRLDQGDGVVWLNMSDPADGPASIVLALLQQDSSATGEYLVVLENLHANLLVRNTLFSCLERLRSDFGLRLQVLATSWKSAAALLRHGEPNRALKSVLAEGRQLINQLLVGSRLDDTARATVRSLAQNDAHIALTAMELYGTLGRVPTEADLEEHYTRAVTGAGQQEALYRLACLGVLEFQMAVREAGRLRQPLEQLRVAGLVYLIDGAYQIGPRRRAQLVMNHARDRWDADQRWHRPEEIVLMHLHHGGERLMKATLSRLDLLVSPDEARPDSLYLLTSWDILIRLGRSLRSRNAADPTWGDNLGAAVFAASALRQLNHPDAWEEIANWLRARWDYADPGCLLPEPVDGETADYADFVEIQQSMVEEDTLLGAEPHLAGMVAGQLDTGRMYRNWVLGLLLGFEGSAPPQHYDESRVKQLVEVAARAREDDGNFYPARVPWVTARVVLGLCQADLRMDHPVVRDACNWLMRQVAQGGPFDNWWRSGTGSWNREEATTAMCLSALVRAGVEMRPGMQTAHAWLMGREREWTIPGREIDLSQVLEANLHCTATAAGTREHLQTLFHRMRTEMKNPTLLPTAPEERLRIPFVAAQLADIVWSIVQMESLKLYGDLFNHRPPEPPEVPQQRVAPVPAESPNRKLLTDRQLRAWQRGVEQIEQAIREQIAMRDGPVRTSAMQEAVDQLVNDRKELFVLTELLDGEFDVDPLARIDALGRRICEETWPELPWPDPPTQREPER
ncbi:hypothetical protein C1I95_24295 [Micromonospora craterilacus]|uniref:Uncharacterized protein n=2 Tax=Micromonospora craterilacus TaxID=1655439 RepID=A0A2W2EL98_9ACTN|nr:hypothetical protein C1I95_24295 [Micromonospora craterilacus]